LIIIKIASASFASMSFLCYCPFLENRNPVESNEIHFYGLSAFVSSLCSFSTQDRSSRQCYVSTRFSVLLASTATAASLTGVQTSKCAVNFRVLNNEFVSLVFFLLFIMCWQMHIDVQNLWPYRCSFLSAAAMQNFIRLLINSCKWMTRIGSFKHLKKTCTIPNSNLEFVTSLHQWDACSRSFSDTIVP